MRNPSRQKVRKLAKAVPVWKLPMRNPSTFLAYISVGGTSSLEATYEESKLHQGPLLEAYLPGLEATYEESKRDDDDVARPRHRLFGSYL